MFTIIAFLLTIAGSVNWLLIGLLQYDFVAGIFGYQASIFSRIIYIIIGASSVFLVFKMFKGKGTLAIFSRRNKKDIAEKIENMQKENKPVYNNIEAGKEFHDSDNHYSELQSYPESEHQTREHQTLFDEHLDKQ